ncbi:MAG: hypothetical protein K2Q22_16165 [Cytophagales bacterium]|nr:hypothetical protein [Cytophagales bacterium]
MALLAEQIVEEWLTRQGYFTIRGLKLGIDEIDLLAIKKLKSGEWENLHIEVQVSIRPVGYISKLDQFRQIDFNIRGDKNATKRTDEQLETAVKDWVHKKYKVERKYNLRQNLVQSDNWKFMFVHGKVKDPKELDFIKSNNIEVISISEIIKDLQNPKNLDFTTRSATDIIELLGFVNSEKSQNSGI